MRVILQPRQNELDFPKSGFDIDINSTADHLISFLTLKYNTIDATTLALYYKGKLLPYEEEVFKHGVIEDSEIEVRLKGSRCCMLL